MIYVALAVLVAAGRGPPAQFAPAQFVVHVLDAQTNRGVPLIWCVNEFTVTPQLPECARGR